MAISWRCGAGAGDELRVDGAGGLTGLGGGTVGALANEGGTVGVGTGEGGEGKGDGVGVGSS